MLSKARIQRAARTAASQATNTLYVQKLSPSGRKPRLLPSLSLKQDVFQYHPWRGSGSSLRHSSKLAVSRHEVTTHVGSLVANPDHRFVIVVARFNDLVTKLLLDGALESFTRHGVSAENIEVVWVPGSFELPVAAKSLAKRRSFNAVVCIGVVVRGATAHYDAVVSAATSGVLNASLDTGVPVIFGVLTCDTMEQAMDRAGGKVGNKGGEAAVTAIEMANLLGDLREQDKARDPW